MLLLKLLKVLILTELNQHGCNFIHQESHIEYKFVHVEPLPLHIFSIRVHDRYRAHEFLILRSNCVGSKHCYSLRININPFVPPLSPSIVMHIHLVVPDINYLCLQLYINHNNNPLINCVLHVDPLSHLQFTILKFKWIYECIYHITILMYL